MRPLPQESIENFEHVSFSRANSAEFKAELKKLAKVDLFKSIKPSLIDWSVIASCLYFANSTTSLLVDLIVMVIIATRQHAMMVIVHEAAHYRICDNHVWNDLLSNYLAGFPAFFCTRGYRKNHHKHHRFLNSDKDPDWVRKIHLSEWQFPKSKSELIKTAGKTILTSWFKLALLFYSFSGIGQRSTYSNLNELSLLVQKMIFYSSVTASAIYLGYGEFLVQFWLVPFFAILPIIERLRSVSEHFALPYLNPFSDTRDILCNPIEAFLFGPHHIRYHLCHHLYPEIPQYNLPKLHQLLQTDATFRQFAHQNDAYLFGGKKSVLMDLQNCKKMSFIKRAA